MKRHKWPVLLGVLLAMLSVLIGGCITVVVPQSSDSPSTTPPDIVPTPSASAPGGSAPTINYFTANPPDITQGASSMFSWNISGVSAASINQSIGTVGASGTIPVSPLATITYTLTASNISGSAVATTQVVVSGAPSPL